MAKFEWKDMKNCPNCGAPLEGYKCSYCGTVFMEPVPTLEVYSIDPRIETLAAYTEQSYRRRKSRIPKEKLSEWAVNELTGKLAEGLASYMRLDIREDPVRECTVIQGTVRIVPPDFRY